MAVGQRAAIRGVAQRDHTPLVLPRTRVDAMHGGIVDDRQVRCSGGVGHIGRGELVDSRLGLRDMNVRTGSGVVRGRSADANAAIAVIRATTWSGKMVVAS